MGHLHYVSSRSDFSFEFSEIFVIGESATPRLAEFSFKHSKADSATPRLTESESRRVGESFFTYEYLCEFEAKIGTARKVV